MLSYPPVSHKHSNVVQRRHTPDAHTPNADTANMSRFLKFSVHFFIVLVQFILTFLARGIFSLPAGWPNFFPSNLKFVVFYRFRSTMTLGMQVGVTCIYDKNYVSVFTLAVENSSEFVHAGITHETRHTRE